MFTLIAMGTGVAWVYSVVATLAPASSRCVSGYGRRVAVYFEAAAVITVLVLLGQVLELRARERTGGAIRALLDLAPKTAVACAHGGEDEEVALERSRSGIGSACGRGQQDPGGRRIVEGKSSVDESLVTGESMPVAKPPGTSDRRHDQPDRELRDACREGRPRHHVGPDRPDGGGRPAESGAHPAAGGPGRGWFVPAVIGVAVLAFLAWAVWGPAPALGYA